jgi:Domain of unknown function (DUF4387)
MRLRDAATMIRSKNAGPFLLTIDVFFDDNDWCHRVLDSGTISAMSVATLYGVPMENVRIIHVPQASAVKITIPRPLPAGDVGDNDVAGGQQFTPLLELEIL